MAQQVLRGTSPGRAPIDVMISVPIETLLAGNKSAADLTSLATKDNAGNLQTKARPSALDALMRSPTNTLRAAVDARSPVTQSQVTAACCSDSTHIACSGAGTAISAAAARRLSCDAGVVVLIEDANGNALSAGRKTRTVSASLKRAMLRRDCKCRFPGCNARAFLEAHHIKHWADGGVTELGNVIGLCSFHHRFVHEYGWRLELDVKTNIVSAYEPARHRWMPGVPCRDEPLDDRWRDLLADDSITAETRQVWDATPVDYGTIVDVVLRAEARECE